MLKKILIISVILALAGFSFTSCNKVENKINRTWLKESMMAEYPAEIIWDFQDGGTLVRLYNAGEITDTAYYTIEKQTLFTAIKIIEAGTLSGIADPNGLFKVDEISDDKLILTRYEMLDESTEGAYLRREFLSLD
ncbi:MAG: hypothetical protein U9N51_10545 [Bacteroidota bacterium]|nr:hypothetical protein [Bacteroidota bacterium]